MDDSTQRYRLTNDAKASAFTIWPDTSTVKTTLAYSWADSSHLDLHGAIEGDSVMARLQKVSPAQFALLNRGFHWVERGSLQQVARLTPHSCRSGSMER
jgi:hypothetical protein